MKANRILALLALAAACILLGGCRGGWDDHGYHYYVSEDQHYDYPTWVDRDLYDPTPWSGYQFRHREY